MIHAASGVSANVNDDSVNVSPLVIDFAVVNAAENKKFPAVVESQTEMWDSVSEPDAHDAQDKVPDIAFDPPDAADQVIAFRVVFADAAVVAAAPGSAVCSFTAVVAGAVNAVPASMSNHLLARFTVCRPTVTGRSPQAQCSRGRRSGA